MAPVVEREPLDPSEIIPVVPPVPLNPLDLMGDAQLQGAEHTLTLVCGRNKAVFKQKHRGHACAMLRIVTAERKRRGLELVA